MSRRVDKNNDDISNSSGNESRNESEESSKILEERKKKPQSRKPRNTPAASETEPIEPKKTPTSKSDKLIPGPYDPLNIFRIRVAQATKIGKQYLPSTYVGITDRTDGNPNLSKIKYVGMYFVPITEILSNKELIKRIFGWDLIRIEREIRNLKIRLYGEELDENDESQYKDWETPYDFTLVADNENLEEYQQIEGILNSYKPLKASAPQPYKYKRRFEPLLKVQVSDRDYQQRPVTANDWLEIIDKSNTSRLIPVIFGGISEDEERYQLNGFSVFRIDKQRDVNVGLLWDQYRDTPTINKAFRTANEIPDKVLTELKKSIEARFKHTTIICFLYMGGKVYKLTYIIAPGVPGAENLHGFTLEFPNEQINVESLLSNTFPNLVPGRSFRVSTYAIFKIDNLELDEAILFDMVRRDDLMRRYLRIVENKLAYPYKKKPYLKFRNYHDSEDEEININFNQITYEDVSKTTKKEPKRSKDVEIIATLHRFDQVNVFAKIFLVLMRYYSQHKEEYRRQVSSFLSRLPEPIKAHRQRAAGLAISHPLFDENYFSMIPPYRVPEITTSTSKSSVFWEKGEKLFRYTCPNNFYTIPSTRLNPYFKDGSGLISKLPYCRADYEDEKKNVSLEREATKKKPLMNDAYLALDRLGDLNPSLESFLSVILPKTPKRFGNVPGYDSFIGAILIAVNDPIMKLDNPVPSIRKLRINISQAIFAAVCAQENPGKSILEIEKDLYDVDIEFDSRRFISAAETFFGVNIFIFETVNGESRFEIPNHRYFSARRFNPNLPSILMFRFHAAGREDQYQLIMSITEDKESIRIWSVDITRRLIKLYQQVNTVYFRTNRIYKNIFTLDFISPANARAQILDSSGKCRGLVFELSGSSLEARSLGSGSLLTFLTLPCAPYNLPVTQPTFIKRKLAIDFINLNKDKNKGRLFPYGIGNISGISTVNNNKSESLIGIWYSMINYQQAIYIPVVAESLDSNEYNKLIRYPPLVLDENISDTLSDFSADLTGLRMIFHILRWLNAIAGNTRISLLEPLSPDLETLFEFPPITNYSFKISRSFPNFDNLNNALAWLETNTKGLVISGKIMLPSINFVTYFKMILLRAESAWTNRVSYIPNFYLYRTDFRSRILFSYEEVLHVLNRDSEYDISRAILNPSKPILYVGESLSSGPKGEGGQVYLYYRVNLQEQERIEITQSLFQEIRGVTIPENQYVEYDITNDGQLVAVRNSTGQHADASVPFLTLISNGILFPLL